MKQTKIKFSQHAPLTWYPSCQEAFPPKLEDVQVKTLKNQWSCSVAGFDVEQYDLSQYPADMFSFTSLTKWGKKPKGLNPEKVLEDGKNPGLGVRELHKKGIDGSGVSMAIIDSPLTAHPEYQDNIVHYETFGFGDNPYASMHASAVSSIAVGKSCGIAPKAKLYFFSANSFENFHQDGMYLSEDKQSYKHHVQALKRILEINKQLPEKEKIAIVSVSWDLIYSKDDYSKQMEEVLEECKKAGIFVNHTGIHKIGFNENGLDRDIFKSPDDISAYMQGYHNQDKYHKNTLCFPMCHRTVASHVKPNEYIHEAAGGWSWIKPYESALFVLAKQVSPDLTFEEFWEKGLKTGVYNEKVGGTIIQPKKLIESLQAEKSLLKTLKRHCVKRTTSKQIERK